MQDISITFWDHIFSAFGQLVTSSSPFLVLFLGFFIAFVAAGSLGFALVRGFFPRSRR